MSTIGIRWEGAFLSQHSLAHVNRECCLSLLPYPDLRLSLLPTGPEEDGPRGDERFHPLQERYFAPLTTPVRVEVRHQFPPSLEPPRADRLALMLPWEFGALPATWVSPIREHATEIWCYSRAVEEVYLASGIPAERLYRVPLGVDPSVFHPEVPPHVLTDEPGAGRLGAEPRFVFLYVGGTIYRKGADLLLEAYQRAFSAYDPVLLVVKDTGTRTVYREGNLRERLLATAQDATRPPVVYLDAEMSPAELAGVFTAADCVVQPYRGEGFCLPALEAMACGRPVVVPAGGATDDFVDETVGWRLPAERRTLPGDRVGDLECCAPPWLLEPSVDALARLLREVVGCPEEVRRRGAAAAARVRSHWTWSHTATGLLTRISSLAGEVSPSSESHIPPQELARPDPRGEGRGPALNGGTPDREVEEREPTVDAPPWVRGRLARFDRPRISLTMIVKNEERVLADCLRSLAPWVDQIVVVDTGSTDRTVEIALSFGAEVHHFTWCDSFAAARNEALRYATGDWIFWVDADDVLPFEHGVALRETVAHAPEDVLGFLIPVQFLEDGTSSGGCRTEHVKLFRNLPNLRWEFRIHEQILGSLRQYEGRLERCPVVVLHANYDTSPEGQAGKKQRDDRLLRLDIREHPQHPFINFNWGMTEQSWGRHRRAVRWLRRCLRFSHPEDQIRRKAWIFLCGSLAQLGHAEQAREAVETGLAEYPGDVELLFHAGNLAFHRGEIALARRLYEEMLAASPQRYLGGHAPNLQGFKGQMNLGNACWALGDYPAARAAWLRAMVDNPREPDAALRLFHVALEQDDVPTAREVLARVREREGDSPLAQQLAVRLAERTGARDPLGLGEGPLRQAVGADPDRPELRLRLARLLLGTHREQEALPHLERLADQGVAEAAFYLGVNANRQGDFPSALAWMERAQALNPDHADTRDQVRRLREAVREPSQAG